MNGDLQSSTYNDRSQVLNEYHKKFILNISQLYVFTSHKVNYSKLFFEYMDIFVENTSMYAVTVGSDEGV